MRFCPMCGNFLESDDFLYCNKCGAKLVKSIGGDAVDNNGAKRDILDTAPRVLQVEHSMKWYKFVIYVQLILTIVSCLLNALQSVSGIVYGMSASIFYSRHIGEILHREVAGLQIVDTMIGLCYIGFAVFVFYVRQQLARFKEAGPALYYAVLICVQLVPLVSNFVRIAVINSNPMYDGMFVFDAGSIIGGLLGAAVIIILNKIYFDKRKYMFIN